MRRRPRPLVAANWKMNGLRRDGVERARDLAARATRWAPKCEIVLCPPATLIHVVGAALSGSPVALGSQDCHDADKGAHTGDIGAPMLADAGCRFVIVGHSERRRDHGETDSTVRAKAEAAHRAGLTAIVCLGESEAEREAGLTLEVVARQLEGSLPAGAGPANAVIAYEPVWAIGTGRTPSPDETADVHRYLRNLLIDRLGEEGRGIRLLYGGSVTP
ncbi:MAG: triose-phosphate isomerase, partial [Alphaproteobacteria bacterium]